MLGGGIDLSRLGLAELADLHGRAVKLHNRVNKPPEQSR